MGCCKTKMDVNSGITYNEEDELPKFEAQIRDDNNIKVRGGITPSKDIYESTNDPTKNIGSEKINDNPRFNVSMDNNNSQAERGNTGGFGGSGAKKNIQGNYDAFNESSNHNGMKLGDIEKFTKKLYLTIKESKFNKIGTVLEITPKGLTGSTRNANDGIVYFGLHALDFKNDFLFKAEEGVNKQHFEIKFINETNPGYYVKNLQGSGVFIKIEEYLNLKDGVIISFGSNHLLVSISNSDYSDQRDITVSNIKFKAIYGPNKGEE